LLPELFAPGIITTGLHEGCAFFSPDGEEFYFHKRAVDRVVIVCTIIENGRWTPPRVAPFSGRYSDGEPHLSYDGQILAFSSNRPISGTGEPLPYINLWAAERSSSGWGEPKPFDPPINTESNNLHPTFSSSGNLFFASNRDGEYDIYISRFMDGKYGEPEKLSDAVNSPFGDADAYLAPDGSCLVFCSWGREDCLGDSDMYISFRKKDGTWTTAKNMGEKINTEFREVDPVITFDGKYLFFRSNRRIHKPYSEIPITYEDIIDMMNCPGNGSGDIYWVDAQIIEDLKPEGID
jgi:Tol biopolymer transport system component